MFLQEQLYLSAPWREQWAVLCGRALTLYSLHWSFGFIEISTLMPSMHTKTQKNNYYFGFTHASSKVDFCFTEAQTFYWSILTADDSIKCGCANSSTTGQVGGFQNPGVCLQVFPSFLPHPLPTLLLAPFFARSLTLVTCSLLLNHTEMLAKQAISCAT